MRFPCFTSFAVISSLLALSAGGAIHYVDVNSISPISPYTNWVTAATTIQDAVDVSSSIDQVVVTNGIYRTGGRTAGTSALTNRLVVIQPIAVRSVNGPSVTAIQGYQMPFTTNGDSAIRCAFLYPGASLVGFTLTNGATRVINGPDGWGGGVYSYNASVSNCVFVRNASAYEGGGLFAGLANNCVFLRNQSGSGGGAYDCIINNCSFISNRVSGVGGGFAGSPATNCLIVGNFAGFGGGADSSFVMVNCTVVSNTAGTAGGVYQSGRGSIPSVVNSIIYFNSATNEPDYYEFLDGSRSLGWCCIPRPGGIGIVTNAPRFVNPATGDFRLLSDSPCINGGRNSYAEQPTDLDGNPRILGGTVDIGVFEFQHPLSTLSYGWLQNYGLPTDGSVDFVDTDDDGMNNWQEWIANTDPTDAASFLQMLSPDRTNAAPGVTIHWKSTGVTYFIQRTTDLAKPFSTIVSAIAPNPGIATYRDTTATSTGPYFYRVGVAP